MATDNRQPWWSDPDDDDQAFQARTLKVFAALMGAVVVLLNALDLWHGTRVALLTVGGALLGLALSLWLLRAGRVRLAWGVFLAFGAAYVVVNVLANGGLLARQFPGLLVLVVAAGRMLGPRWALVAAALLALFILALGQMHVQAVLPYLAVDEPPMVRAASALAHTVALGVLCWYVFARNAAQIVHLQRARSSAQGSAEEARRARQQFETIFRANPSAMAIVRQDDGVLTDCNEAMLRLLSRARAAVVGRPSPEVGIPRLPAHGEEAATLAAAQDTEVVLVTGEGTTRVCSLHWSAIQIDGVAHAVAHMGDLTQRKRAEAALVLSEQRFQDFARASGDWFWESDAQGRFTWISDAIASITGMTAADYLGKTRLDLASAVTEIEQETWKSHVLTLARREPFRGFVYRIGVQDSERWLSTSGVPVLDASGQFTGYRGIGADVTARIVAEEKATLAGNLLRAAVEELSESFLLCDPQDRIVIANRHFREADPAIVPFLEQGATYEEFLRLACERGRYPEAVGREQEYIAQRFEQRRNPGQAVERMRGDGVLLVSDRRLPDGSTVTMALDITERKAGERRLEESEARLRAILDNAPGVAVQQFDGDGKVLYWNAASAQLFGFGADEVMGKTLDQLFWTPATTTAWLLAMREAAASGKAIGPVETSFVHRDGGERFILYASFAINESGGAVRYVCMDVDITGRKHAEVELRRSEQLLEQVINAIPMAIFAKDMQSRYIMANNAFLRLTNLTKEDLFVLHTSQMKVPEETRQKSLRDDQWVFTHRQTLDQPDTLLQDAEGNWIPYHSTKIPLLDADGSLVGLLGINRDISGDKKAQEALRASEARFAALFHHSLVPQVVSLADSPVAEMANQAAVDLTGYPVSRLTGEGSADLVLFAEEDDRVRLRQVLAQGGTTAPLDLHILRRDGAVRTVLASAIKIETPAGNRLAWSFNDVTDQRAAQRQLRELNQILERAVRERTDELTRSNAELQVALQNLHVSQDALQRSEKLAALGRIVAGVAHELNTPIGNGLLAASTLAHNTSDFVQEVGRGLRRSALDAFVASASEASAILLRNLERAAELVRSFKQVAVDQTTSHRRTFDLCDVIHEVALAHRPALRGSGVEIRLDIPTGITLDSYPGPLGQVVANLVNNAVLHGYGEGVAGTVDIAARQAGEERVLLTVTDHGQGIAARDLGRIFDPFFTTRLGRGGSGLGLNIVHNMVHGVLGGEIKVDSSPGRGTRFAISLPLVAPSIQEAAPGA